MAVDASRRYLRVIDPKRLEQSLISSVAYPLKHNICNGMLRKTYEPGLFNGVQLAKM